MCECEFTHPSLFIVVGWLCLLWWCSWSWSPPSSQHEVESFGRVFIRKRPLLPHELQRKDWDAVTCLHRQYCVLHDARMHANMKRKFMVHRRFRFDRVFNMDEDNDTVRRRRWWWW